MSKPRRGHLGSEEAQKHLREIEKQRSALDAHDLESILSLPTGRRFMWRLIANRCEYGSLSYAGIRNGDETVFREGRRSIGVGLWNEIQDKHPHLFKTMFTEAVDAAMKEIR